MEVAGYNLLADVESGAVHFEYVRKVLHHCGYLELAGRDEKLTTGFHTFCVSLYAYRNIDAYRLGLVHCEEVHMETLVGDRVPLKFVKHCIELLTVVELEVYDVRVRSVCEGFESLCLNSEEDVLHSESVDVARNESLSADSLDSLLVSYCAQSAFQFDVFHL